MAEKPAVYGIYCKKTGKWYVGASKEPQRRIKDHFYSLRNDARMYRHYGEKYNFGYRGEMGRDYSIHGDGAFTHKILQSVDNICDLGRAELYWIDLLDSRRNGYNKQAAGRNRYWK